MKSNMLKLVAFMFIALPTFARQGNTPTSNEKLQALKGTYEIKALTRDMPMLPSNLADIIEKNRKENETNVVKLNDNAEVIIYPKSQIKKD